MKTLRKLKINSEKMLKKEELINLRGGYEVSKLTASCWYWEGQNPVGFVGPYEEYNTECSEENALNLCASMNRLPVSQFTIASWYCN